MRKFLVFATAVILLLVAFGSAFAESPDYGNSYSSAYRVSIGATTSGNISPTGDKDYFKFTAALNMRYIIKTGGTLSSDITLYKRNGTTVLSGPTTPQISWQCTSTAGGAGTYYVRVRKLNGASGTGSYTILIDQDADNDGYSATSDCNDNDATIHPGATEIPGDGIDQDCSGADLPITFEKAYMHSAGEYNHIESKVVQPTTDGGYILIGDIILKTDRNGVEQWRNENIGAISGQQTTDGGYVVINTYDNSATGEGNIRLTKLGTDGVETWHKNFGNVSFSYSVASVQQTNDGGYIILGTKYDYTPDIYQDVYLIKASATGDMEWDSTTNLDGYDDVTFVRQTTDGGYVVLANSTDPNTWVIRMYVLKFRLNVAGNGIEEEWRKNANDFGIANVTPTCVQQTNDSGYVISGSLIDAVNSYDAYILKLNSLGVKQWDNHFGGTEYDEGNFVQQTTDGGYILSGTTRSFDNDSHGNMYIIKTLANGTEEWSKSIGRDDWERGRSVRQTSDGGYVISGATDSFSNNFSTDYMYLVKTDAQGNYTREYYRDADSDGYGDGDHNFSVMSVTQPVGYALYIGDCNESDSAIHPHAVEVCEDGIDQDCDGSDAPCATFYRDVDGDGYGISGDTVIAAVPPAGYVYYEGDCNDSNVAIYPGAYEICSDGIDQDCDGSDSNGCSTFYRDADADGWGDLNNTAFDHWPPAGYVWDNADCNDNDATIHPGAFEICGDGIDQNCSGVDSDGCATWYRDADGDGYGDANNTTLDHWQPEGYVWNAYDCNDNDAAINPSVAELCDGIDNDCDGQIDEGCATYYQDADSDTCGNPNATIVATSRPTGYVTNSYDCDDSNAAINPWVAEQCDSIDNNCDGQIDEVCVTYYRDADGDSYGNPSISLVAITRPTGYVANNLDCNDNNASINPWMFEQCDNIDNNCDGQIDENCYYRDTDGDTYGNPNYTTSSPSQPEGFVVDKQDCDDYNAAINPGVAEVADDGIDNNCDGLFANTYYLDADGDTYGNANISQIATSQPSEYVLDNTDCNDDDAAFSPGAVEACDGIDNDCDGVIDGFEKKFGGNSQDWGTSVQQTSDGGFVALGYVSEGAGVYLTHIIKTDCDGTKTWETTLNCFGAVIRQTSDGGYMVIGTSSAMYLAKTDENGILIWEKTFSGGSWGNSGQQTTDGGYILLGSSAGGGAMYLVKTDSNGDIKDENGNYLTGCWEKTIGDPAIYGWYSGSSVQQTTDGGYIVLGNYWYLGLGDPTISLVKTDSDGNTIWQRNFGVFGADDGSSVQQTTDGGYIVCGTTVSTGAPAGYADIYLIKTNSSGGAVWQKRIGGSLSDHGAVARQTADGGYILLGDIDGYASLLKTDSSGNVSWQKAFPSGYTNGYNSALEQIANGGYILVQSSSDSSPTRSDISLIKTDANGNY